MGLLYILVSILLLRTTDIRKKKCNERIVKLFRKSRRDVSLSQETRSLKRTNLASLSRSCSQFEMLSDFNSLDALEPFHIRPKGITDCVALFLRLCWEKFLVISR